MPCKTIMEKYQAEPNEQSLSVLMNKVTRLEDISNRKEIQDEGLKDVESKKKEEKLKLVRQDSDNEVDERLGDKYDSNNLLF